MFASGLLIRSIIMKRIGEAEPRSCLTQTNNEIPTCRNFTSMAMLQLTLSQSFPVHADVELRLTSHHIDLDPCYFDFHLVIRIASPCYYRPYHHLKIVNMKSVVDTKWGEKLQKKVSYHVLCQSINVKTLNEGQPSLTSQYTILYYYIIQNWLLPHWLLLGR